MNQFGKNLKKHMAIAGYNQTKLAQALGMKQGSISDWFRKDIVPPVERIEQIAKVLGIKPSELIEEDKPYADQDTITISRREYEVMEMEIKYLKQIVELKEEKKQLQKTVENLKNIEDVLPKT